MTAFRLKRWQNWGQGGGGWIPMWEGRREHYCGGISCLRCGCRREGRKGGRRHRCIAREVDHVDEMQVVHRLGEGRTAGRPGFSTKPSYSSNRCTTRTLGYSKALVLYPCRGSTFVRVLETAVSCRGSRSGCIIRGNMIKYSNCVSGQHFPRYSAADSSTTRPARRPSLTKFSQNITSRWDSSHASGSGNRVGTVVD